MGWLWLVAGILMLVLTLTLERWLGEPGCRGLLLSCQGVVVAKESSE